MKKTVLALLALTFIVLGVPSAQAVSLKWVDSNRTVIVDNTVQVTKPSTKWDTQTKNYKSDATVKWVRHVSGANPQIFLRYSQNVKGKTAHHYASGVVKKELAARGIKVKNIKNQVINGRNVSVINGSMGDERYMIGVWRHQDMGFLLECVAVESKFNDFMGDFQSAINSVKIVKEKGL